MDELDQLLEMTVQLAQVCSQVSLENSNLPWFSILEQAGNNDSYCFAQTESHGSFADLLGLSKDTSLVLSQTNSKTCSGDDEAIEMIMLAQCSAEAEGNCKEADDLQALIDAQKLKVMGMKKKRNTTSQRKLPKTHEEAMKVIRNENISQSTKDCLSCLKEAKNPLNKEKSVMDCAKMCGFGMK